MDGKDYSESISEVREWLVEINTNQVHHTKLLESMQRQSTQALELARTAEDKAESALSKANKNHDEMEKYKDEQSMEKKWAIRTVIMVVGVGVTVIIFLMPILVSYYIQ